MSGMTKILLLCVSVAVVAGLLGLYYRSTENGSPRPRPLREDPETATTNSTASADDDAAATAAETARKLADELTGGGAPKEDIDPAERDGNPPPADDMAAIREAVKVESWDAALKRIAKVEWKSGDSAELQMLKGRALVGAGRGTDAGAAFAAAVRLAPDDPEVLTTAATYHNALGDHASALRLFRKAVDADPEALKPRHGLVLTALAAGDAETAHAESRQALGRFPGNLKLMGMAAQASYGMGEYARAADEFEAYLAAGGPDTAMIRFMLAESLRLAGSEATDLIRAHYDAMYKRNPRYIQGLRQYAVFSANTGDRERAVALTRRLLEETDNAPFALDVAGYVHMELENWKEARNFFEKAEDSNWNNPRMWYHMAMVYRKLNESEKADTYMERAKDWARENDPAVLEMIEAAENSSEDTDDG